MVYKSIIRRGKTKLHQNKELEMYVIEKLQLRWSPQLISVSLRMKYPEDESMRISHEAIYMHVYVHSKTELRKLLISQLRQKRSYRGNVRRGVDKRTTIPDAIRIDERPAEVLGREIPGPLGGWFDYG